MNMRVSHKGGCIMEELCVCRGFNREKNGAGRGSPRRPLVESTDQ